MLFDVPPSIKQIYDGRPLYKCDAMVIEEELEKRLKKMPDIVLCLVYAFLFTGVIFVFVFFAKALYTLPSSFDLPWLLIFLAAFLVLLVRKRIKTMRQDTKPSLS